MNKVIRCVKITNWSTRESVEEIGDISGMVEEPIIHTILGERRAVVRAWFDADGNGFEENTILLNDWEV